MLHTYVKSTRKIFVLMAAVIIFCIPIPIHAQSCVQPPDDMVGWWPGDGSADDIVSSNTGIENGVGYYEGKVFEAFRFDGINDYVSVPDDESLRAVGAISIDFWARFDTVPRSGDYSDTILVLEKSRFVDGNGDDYIIYWRADLEGLEFDIADACDGAYHYGAYLPIPTLQPGDMHHFAITAIDRGAGNDSEFHFYVDGIEHAHIPNTNLAHACGWFEEATGELRIGDRDNSHPAAAPFQPFDGLIDELEIFDRALSASEIKAIYDAGSAGKCRTLSVDVDVKPGDEVNSVNPRNKGVIPVSILSTESFDATTIDPLTVRFGVSGAQVRHGDGHIEDTDGDGDFDLLLHLETRDTGIICGDVTVSLVGSTFAGHQIEGFDDVRTVGCK